ncbi:plastocyanin/azurin family copper-binding protein [Halobacillus shinanisalinarum]|uniref:Plastocyanin/azurin family copper-binding protein n=1 Tax=Halobacillus shinanisalinarum TaxID=2932258 RepID=A0ABY4H148_9BACI|nr:plastocyanin/azurin family copper-binding protein [Halobacillus shinanisalinarum]UOQ94021.1 plastocyanin/azurin family copper-binding protein [Halobacillus shinanisalinarum]
MVTPLYLILVTILLLSGIAVGKTVYYKKKVTCMTGMMIAMTLGMSVGLMMGLILGILFSGNLFLSTVLGMLAGMVVGFLAGVPISIMAVLDGLLSGLMGGMMGAMLGEMIAPEYRDAIVKIMFTLFLATMVLLLYMIQKEVKRSETPLFRNPLLTVALLGLIFVAFNQLGPIFPQTISGQQGHSEHNEEGNNLRIKADEFTFSPNKTKIQVGERVTLSLENNGEIQHDLEIINLTVEEAEKNKTHDHGEENDNIHVHAAPGEEKSVSFVPVESGTYRFICTLPGHQESGMFGTIKVS